MTDDRIDEIARHAAVAINPAIACECSPTSHSDECIRGTRIIADAIRKALAEQPPATSEAVEAAIAALLDDQWNDKALSTLIAAARRCAAAEAEREHCHREHVHALGVVDRVEAENAKLRAKIAKAVAKLRDWATPCVGAYVSRQDEDRMRAYGDLADELEGGER